MMGVLRNGTRLQTLFLDARDATLIARFSETRRRHRAQESAPPDPGH